MNPNEPHKQSHATLALAALGVVYGDIGTSPLYAAKEVFNPIHGIPFSAYSGPKRAVIPRHASETLFELQLAPRPAQK